MISLNVTNETSPLQQVILGIGTSQGPLPTLEETYDATSYQSVLRGEYPTDEAISQEMEAFRQVLQRAGVEVFRPSDLPDCNQIFARDVAFTIDDRFFISNMIEDRMREIAAFQPILEQIDPDKQVYLPKEAHTEGGDVLLYNDKIFIGVSDDATFAHYKTARTNLAAVEFLQRELPHKQIVPIVLHKDDHDPTRSVLHLDCAFQPVGNGKAIFYPEGLVYDTDREAIRNTFGQDNLFEVTQEEAMCLATNVFSISPKQVVVETRFERLIHHMQTVWGMEPIPVSYRETSKQGGLFRCSTCPLVRQA